MERLGRVASACPRLTSRRPVAVREDETEAVAGRAMRRASGRRVPRSIFRVRHPMQPEWYESFFSPLALEFWRAVVPPESTREEVDFVEGSLALGGPGRLLDLPCGEGRHALELARRGHRVTGVDLSSAAGSPARAAARR